MLFTVSDKFKGACVKCLRTIGGVAYHHDGPFPLKNGHYHLCPVCKIETTTNFQGTVVIFDIESALAKKLGITTPGTYAIRV